MAAGSLLHPAADYRLLPAIYWLLFTDYHYLVRFIDSYAPIQEIVLVLMARISYYCTRDRRRGASAAAALRTIRGSVRDVLRSSCASRRGQSVPPRALQRQRAEVHASHAWTAERSHYLSGVAALRHRFAVGRGGALATAACDAADARGGARARRDEFSEAGPRLGRREAAVLWRAGQDGELPSGGLDHAL